MPKRHRAGKKERERVIEMGILEVLRGVVQTW